MEIVSEKRSALSETSHLKGNIMNIHKHMEAIFVVALATVGLGTMVIDEMPEATAGAHAPVIRDVAAAPLKAQEAAPMAMLCASKAAPRA